VSSTRAGGKEEGMYVCDFCGRKYRSRAWLDRHVELKHGAEARTPSEAAEESVPHLVEACHALGIDAKDVLSSRVYGDRVVVIEGPVGYKRVWHPE
jgi:hypothetical protein